MSALSPEAALQELKPREPIFHRRQYGTTRGDLEEMTDEAFWEVGASGRVYRRDYCISTLLERYKNPEPHDWPCSDFSITELADKLFLRHYNLRGPDRQTRRTPVWKHTESGLRLVYHQGTVIA